MSILLRALPRRLALAFGVLALLAGCDSPEERAERHFDRGQELLAEGDPDRASIEFRNALRLDDAHLGARIEMARLAEAEGNVRNAFRHYARIADLDPSDVTSRIKLVDMTLASGSLDEAREYLDEALALSPQDPQLIARQAMVLYRLGDTGTGLAKAEEAIALDGDAMMAHILLIADMIANERNEEAMAKVDRLLEQHPTDADLNTIKLRYLAAENDIEALESHLRDLVSLLPDNMNYREALARVYAARGAYDLAEAELRAVLAENPGNIELALQVVQLVGASQGEAAVVAELEAMIEASAEPAQRQRLQFALSDVHIQAGRQSEAKAILETTLEQASNTRMANDARVRLARIEYSEGSVESAQARVDTVLEGDADNVDALAVKAQIEIDEERPGDAILTLRRALSLAPENAQLMLLEARAHERDGNPALVGERLSGATRASNFAPAIALTYARHLLGQDQMSAAETVLEEAARLHPTARDVLTVLAELRLQLGDLAGAEAVGRQLRSLENGDVVADQIAAATMMERGNVESGVRMLEDLVQNPNSADSALAGLISAYLRDGQTERAETLLDSLIAESAANLRAQILRAELHLLAGEVDAAETRLLAGLDNAPDSAQAYLVLARYYSNFERFDEAEAVARQGIEVLPRNQPLKLLLASLLERRGDVAAAIDNYRQLYELNPNSVLVANNLASLLAEFQEGDPEAISFAVRVARRLRASEVPHFQDTYGWIAFLSGEVETAREYLVQAAAGLPNNPLVRYHLGRVYAATGDNALAREELEAALAIDAGFPKADSAREALAALPATDG